MSPPHQLRGSTAGRCAAYLFVVLLSASAPALVFGVPCTGMGRRYCTKAHVANDACPRPCQRKECSKNRPEKSKIPGADRPGGPPTWEEIALSGLYELVYTNDAYLCLSVCFEHPLKGKCEKWTSYAGNKYCSALNCEHDDSNRFVGCHADSNGKMKLPWHKPTCKECARIFPTACKKELQPWIDASEALALEAAARDYCRESYFGKPLVVKGKKNRRSLRSSDEEDTDETQSPATKTVMQMVADKKITCPPAQCFTDDSVLLQKFFNSSSFNVSSYNGSSINGSSIDAKNMSMCANITITNITVAEANGLPWFNKAGGVSINSGLEIVTADELDAASLGSSFSANISESEDDIEFGGASDFLGTPLMLGEARLDVVYITFQLNDTDAGAQPRTAALSQAVAALSGVETSRVLEVQDAKASDNIATVSFIVASDNVEGTVAKLEGIPEADKAELLRSTAGVVYFQYSMTAAARQVPASMAGAAGGRPVAQASVMFESDATVWGLPVYAYVLMGVGSAAVLAATVAASVLVARRARLARYAEAKGAIQPEDIMDKPAKGLTSAS